MMVFPRNDRKLYSGSSKIKPGTLWGNSRLKGMENQNIVLINGRFEFLTHPDKLEIFDMWNLEKDGARRVIPIHTVTLNARVKDKEAGKLALAALRDSKYITQSEYFSFLDIFLAAQTADGKLLYAASIQTEI
jgi:hypothetical protein